MPNPCLCQTGVFIPEKSNVWRDCCDGMLDWVKEHVEEVGVLIALCARWLQLTEGCQQMFRPALWWGEEQAQEMGCL